MRGGDDSRVDSGGLRTAQPLDLPVLQHAQKRFRPSASSNTETLQRAIDSTTSLYTVLSDVTP
jgi:hypothetical protein